MHLLDNYFALFAYKKSVFCLTSVKTADFFRYSSFLISMTLLG
jgi:hypothetical protein